MNKVELGENMEKVQRARTKPCLSLNPCIKHLPTQQRGKKSILTHAMPRQQQVYSTVKWKQENTEQNEESKTVLLSVV